jgi:hypothetical protein
MGSCLTSSSLDLTSLALTPICNYQLDHLLSILGYLVHLYLNHHPSREEDLCDNMSLERTHKCHLATQATVSRPVVPTRYLQRRTRVRHSFAYADAFGCHGVRVGYRHDSSLYCNMLSTQCSGFGLMQEQKATAEDEREEGQRWWGGGDGAEVQLRVPLNRAPSAYNLGRKHLIGSEDGGITCSCLSYGEHSPSLNKSHI